MIKKILLTFLLSVSLVSYADKNSGIKIVAEDLTCFFPKSGEIPQDKIPGGAQAKDTRLTLWTISSMASVIDACFQRIALANLWGNGTEKAYPESGFYGPIEAGVFTNDLQKEEIEGVIVTKPFNVDFFADLKDRTFTNTTRVTSKLLVEKNEVLDSYMRALLEGGNSSLNPWNDAYHAYQWPYAGDAIYAWGSSWVYDNNIQPETDGAAEGLPEDRGWTTSLLDADLGQGTVYTTWADIYWQNKSGKTSDVSEWLEPTIDRLYNVKASQTKQKYQNRQSTPLHLALDEAISNITFGVTGTRSIDKKNQSQRIVWSEWAWPLAFWKLVDIAYIKQDVLPQMTFDIENWYLHRATTFEQEIEADVEVKDYICYLTNVHAKSPTKNTTGENEKMYDFRSDTIQYYISQHTYGDNFVRVDTNLEIAVNKTNILSNTWMIPEWEGLSVPLSCDYTSSLDGQMYVKIMRDDYGDSILVPIDPVRISLTVTGEIASEMDYNKTVGIDDWMVGDPYNRQGYSRPCLYPHPLTLAASVDAPDIYVSAVQGYDDGAHTQSMIRVRKCLNAKTQGEVNEGAIQASQELIARCKKVAAQAAGLDSAFMDRQDYVINKAHQSVLQKFFAGVESGLTGGEDIQGLACRFIPRGRYEIARVRPFTGEAPTVDDFKIVYTTNSTVESYAWVTYKERIATYDCQRYTSPFADNVVTRTNEVWQIYRNGIFLDEEEIFDNVRVEEYDPSQSYDFGYNSEVVEQQEYPEYDDENYIELEKFAVSYPLSTHTLDMDLTSEVQDIDTQGYQHFSGAVKFNWKVCY